MPELPVCPYCAAPLIKAPQRKTKCSSCGQTIHVKRTVENRDKRLMTDAQANAAEVAWSRYHAINQVRQDLSAFGMGDDPMIGLLDLGMGDPHEIEERLLLVASEIAEPPRLRLLALKILAMRRKPTI